MYVQRTFYRVRHGCTDELVRMILDEFQHIGFRGVYRVSTPTFGPRDVVCWEAEFADLAAYEQFWADWLQRPTTPAFMNRWGELTEAGGTNELWKLHT